MYPEYVQIEEKQYKINTDFRVAIECNRIAEDTTIGDLERGLAIIYVLFGEEGLNAVNHHEELLILAKKYLSCGKETNENKNIKPDMDYIEDYSYIATSFMSDYHIDLDKEQMHWWKFSDLMNGLSDSEFGNCCILNKIRNIRNCDITSIKDPKEKQKIIKAKQQFALKKYNEPKIKPTDKQRTSAMEFFKALGIERS